MPLHHSSNGGGIKIAYVFINNYQLYSAHQKSGDRVKETIQFYVVITYTFVSELSKIMM